MTEIAVGPGEVHVLTWEGPDPTKQSVLEALGAPEIDPEKFDIFGVMELAPMTLSEFLVEGHGIEQKDIAPERDRLDALDGTVVVLPAFALPDRRGTLKVSAPAHHVARLVEPEADRGPALGVKSEAARGTLSTGGRMSDARMGGMVATGVLLFLAVFVVIFVLMAG